MKKFKQCKKCNEIQGGLRVRGCRHIWVKKEQCELIDISVGDCGTVYGYRYQVREYIANTDQHYAWRDTLIEARACLLVAPFDNGEVLRYARSSNTNLAAPWITAGVEYRKINGTLFKIPGGH